MGQATGFTVERGGKTFLITNRHVVRGRRQDDDAISHELGVVPDELRIVHTVGPGTGPATGWSSRDEPLYDANGRPLWREDSVHGGRVDVVALPLTQLEGVRVKGYDPWAPTDGVLPPSQPVSIVGFPFDAKVGGYLAVWTRGFVASEVDYDYDDLPAYLVDARTRDGQSGSPVLLYSNGTEAYFAVDGDVVMGAIEQFAGVYSSRIRAESDLGIVWKPSVVRQIVDMGERPDA